MYLCVQLSLLWIIPSVIERLFAYCANKILGWGGRPVRPCQDPPVATIGLHRRTKDRSFFMPIDACLSVCLSHSAWPSDALCRTADGVGWPVIRPEGRVLSQGPLHH